MSDNIDDRVNHAQEQNRHANVQSDVSIGMEGDGDSGALSKSRDMLREHNELASEASEQMLQQDDAMIDDEIRSGNEGVAEGILNNGLEQGDKQNQLPSEPEEPKEPEPQSEPESQPESREAQPDNGGAGSSQQETPSSVEKTPEEPSESASVAASYVAPATDYSEGGSSAHIGGEQFGANVVAPTAEPVAPEAPSVPKPDVNGRSDYLMRQSERIEQHANIADATANKGDRNMMRQGVLHQMDKRTLVHDTGMVSRLQGRAKTNMLTHNNKLAADIRDSARTQSKLTAIYSKTHKNASEAYRKANKLRQAAQQLKLQHVPKPVTPGPVKPKPVDPNKPKSVDPNTPKSVEPKKLEPKKDNPQTESPKEDFGPHIPQKLGTPKTFKKPVSKPKPKPKPKPKAKSDKDGKPDKSNDKGGGIPWWLKPLTTPQVLGPIFIPPVGYVEKNDSKSNARLAALNDRLDDGRRASHQASNGVSYC